MSPNMCHSTDLLSAVVTEPFDIVLAPKETYFLLRHVRRV